MTTASTHDGSALLVTERVDGRGLDDLTAPPPTDDLLRALWREVAKLHAAHIAHRDLRLANIVVDEDGRPWITDFGFAESAASERSLAHDRAELLTSLSTLVAPERAVATAADVIGADALAPALALLQPMALTAATRKQLRRRPDLLNRLRAEVAKTAGLDVESVPAQRLTRVRIRTVAALLVGAVAVYVLIPQAAELRHTYHALRTARWTWLVPATLASGLTYVMAAVGLHAASGLPLPLGRTTLAQFASSVANRLVPGGVGGAATNVRYLERSGLERPQAVASVGLTSAAGFLVHCCGLITVGLALAVGRRIPFHHRLPSHWTPLVVAAVALAAVGLVLRTPVGQQRIRPAVEVARRTVWALFDDRGRASVLLLAAAGVTVGYILCLAASLQAFRSHASLLTVAAAYLAGSAIGAASPTPGGLGAVEAALVAGLTRLGVASGPAIAGVLTYRLVSYWLPILPGAFALRALHRREAL